MRQTTPCDSAVLLAALGILGYAASMVTHEALGHGGYCLACGGHTTLLTPWLESCAFPGAPALGIKAAGPGAQFGAGLLAWLALRLLSPGAPRLRFFLWLYMVFNLFVSLGYVAFSGITDLGDAAEIIARLHAQFVWRGALILLGSVVYLLSMRMAAFELKRFAGLDDRTRRLFRLVCIPYAAAGIFACCICALNEWRGHGAAFGWAVASSFGAGSGMLFLPGMQRGMESTGTSTGSSPAIYLEWGVAWGALTAAVIVVFLFYLGPGLR